VFILDELTHQREFANWCRLSRKPHNGIIPEKIEGISGKIHNGKKVEG